MQALIEEAKSIEKPILSFVQPETKETEVLYKVLSALKIDDIDLTYEGGILVARDNDNLWSGKEFYEFLVKEAFVFEKDGSVLGIRDELLKVFKELSESYGVPVKDSILNPYWQIWKTVR